jgi:hypothetical protein
LFFVVESAADHNGPPPPPGATARPAPLSVRRGEPLADAIRRIGLGRLDRAIRVLSQPRGAAAIEPGGAAVEGARALLRLVRPATGDRIYLFEDRRLRDVLRAIGPARELQSAPQALAGLRDRLADRLAPGTFAAASAQLAAAAHPVGDAEIAGALEVLVSSRTRWAAFVLGTIDDEFAMVEPGLRLTYARGQLRLGEAYRHGTDGAFAKWRTQVRYLRDQVRMLDPDWATLGLSEQLGRLTDALTEARHLVTMADIVDDLGLGEDVDDRDLLRMLVKGRCQEIYRRLYTDGAGTYGDEPVDFTAEFGKYWRAWRAG